MEVEESVKGVVELERGGWELVAAVDLAPDWKKKEAEHKKAQKRLPKALRREYEPDTVHAKHAGYIIFKDRKVVVSYSNDLSATPSTRTLSRPSKEAVACCHGLYPIQRWTDDLRSPALREALDAVCRSTTGAVVVASTAGATTATAATAVAAAAATAAVATAIAATITAATTATETSTATTAAATTTILATEISSTEARAAAAATTATATTTSTTEPAVGHLVQEGRDLLAVLRHQLVHLASNVAVLLVHHRESVTNLPTRPVEVDNLGHTIDIETTGSHIRSHSTGVRPDLKLARAASRSRCDGHRGSTWPGSPHGTACPPGSQRHAWSPRRPGSDRPAPGSGNAPGSPPCRTVQCTPPSASHPSRPNPHGRPSGKCSHAGSRTRDAGSRAGTWH
ncbi:hypothetical protein GQ600_6180 [Phytophthora cactorum]|nr:hypothetical protein GQ600_6180 [Phytophthora cactorum]